MKVAVIGSRSIYQIPLETILPPETDELVSGGAVGVDSYVRRFAREHHITLTEFLPDYQQYGRVAPLLRNKQIVEYADLVLAFWDGTSRGTHFVIQYCKKTNTPLRVFKATTP